MKKKKIRKPKIIYFIGVGSIIVLIIIGIIWCFSLENIELVIKEVGINQEVKLSDIASCSHGNLLEPDKFIDTSTLGKKI